MSIKIRVPGLPVAQPRHRAGTGFGGKPRMYLPDDHAVHAYKATVNLVARGAMGRAAPLVGPVSVALMYLIPRAKRERATGYGWRAVKPDVDNLTKAVLDACKGVVYEDDCQIVAERALKLSVPPALAGLYAMFGPAGDAEGAAAAFVSVWNGS